MPTKRELHEAKHLEEEKRALTSEGSGVFAPFRTPRKEQKPVLKEEETGVFAPAPEEPAWVKFFEPLRGKTSEDSGLFAPPPTIFESFADAAKNLYPGLIEVDDIQAAETIALWVESDPYGFSKDIISKGRTIDTENILRGFNVSDKDLDEIFSPVGISDKTGTKWWTLDFWLDTFFSPYKGTDITGKASASFLAGIGDVINTSGGTSRWLGYEDTGEVLSKIGSTLQRVAPPDTLGEFELGDLGNPDFYATKIVRTIPFALSLAPLSIGGYTGGAAVATAVGLNRLGAAIVGGFAGAALSRPVESALEAGGAYDDAIARGKTPKEAQAEADEVFRKNMILAGADAFQIAIALAPTPKWVPLSLVKQGLVRTATVGGKMVIVGLSEGGEEVYQDMISRHARGEEWRLDPISKEVFAIGAVMGIGMGLGGDVLSGIVDRSKEKMPPFLMEKYNGDVSKFRWEGYTQEQAEAKALDLIMQTTQGEGIIREAIKEARARPEAGFVRIPGEGEEITPEVTKEVAGISNFSEELLTTYRNADAERIIKLKREIANREAGINELKRTAKSEKELALLSSEEESLKTEREAISFAESRVSQYDAEIARRSKAIPTPEPGMPEAPTLTEGATARVFSRIQTEPAETGFVEKVKRGWHKFNIKMVDDLDPLKRITDQLKKGGVNLSIEENPYLLARLLRGVTSKATSFLEQGTFGKQFWKVENGKAVPNYTGESLDSILQEVKDPVTWRDFSTYLTARRAVELSGRNIETGIEVVDAQASIAELEGKYKDFTDLAQRVYKYQDSLLVYAQEMGLLSEDLLGKLRKYGNYVPFYRVFNELQAKGLMGKKMANIASPIKRIKGSEREIINPLESIVKNTYVLISAAERNQVGIALANLVDQNPELADTFERIKTPIAKVATVSAKELGVEVEGLTGEEEEQMVDIFRPSFFVSGDEVTVLIDGKKNYYKVDADLRDSLLALNRESLGTIGKILGAPARWLRAGATLSPDFMFRNPARDQLTAYAYSNYGFMPGVDFLRGVASIIRKDSDYQLFKMSGAEHSMLVSMDRNYLQKTFKEIVEGKGFTEYVKHPMELFRIISELGEKGTRLGEFKKGIKSGAVPLEAGYSARSVTLDFAQMGTTAQAVNTLIAFFNANIRGWGKMVSSFKEHPIRTSAKVFAGITLPSILLYYANRDDDRWKEIPQWQKDLFWIVMTDENIYRIPKPFELGIIFGSVPERFLEWLDTNNPDLMKDVAQSLVEAGSPGFIPTAGLPILEWITNYSFFKGTKLVPGSREKMPSELQYTPWTSEVSRKLGEILNLPPIKIDNLFYGWTGGLGRYATDILDGILKGTGISKDIPEPSPTLADRPVIKAFVVRNPYGSAGETVNDFYEILEKYEQGEKYLKEMMEAGELEKYNKYKAEHPELLFFADFDSARYKEAIENGETPKDVFYSASARYLRRVARELTELRNKQDLIYKSKDISPEEKRRLIDEIDILKTNVARRGLDLLIGREEGDVQFFVDLIDTSVNRLGEVIEESPVLSLEKPDIYDMGKLRQEFNNILEGATAEDLDGIEGMNSLAYSFLEKKGIDKTIEPLVNKKIYDIDFNLKEGVSFDEYYKQWNDGFIEDSPLENLSKRQVDALREYYKLEGDSRKEFLGKDENIDLIGYNPQKDYLESHPRENALRAIWGDGKLLTTEAYDEYIKLKKELDIPDDALPDTAITGNLEAFLLRTSKFREIEASIEKYQGLGGKEWEEEIKNLRRTKVDGDVEFRDIERKITAINVGTEEEPIPQKTVDAFVAHRRITDETSGNSPRANLNRYNIPELNEFLMNEDYWGKQALQPLDEDEEYLANYLVPKWQIRVDYETEYAEHDALPVKKRPTYLQEHEGFRMARRREEALGMSSKGGERFPLELVETFVGYTENPIKGYRRERMFYDSEGNRTPFADTMALMGNDGKGMDIIPFNEIPDERYDVVYETYEDLFEELDSYSDVSSPNFKDGSVKDKNGKTERQRATQRLMTSNRDFQMGIWEQQGYKLFIGKEEFVPAHVGWKAVEDKGKPKDAKVWFEDDWYLIDNPEYYKAMTDLYIETQGKQGWNPEGRDLSRAPSREVYKKYLEYQKKPEGQLRLEYRAKNLEFSKWLEKYFGLVPIAETYRKRALTTREEIQEKMAKEQEDFEMKMRELEEKIRR